jgi:tight adherence protein B
MAGKEFEGPMGEEMLLMYESQRVGMSLPEAAMMAARRMPITEMRLFATGMTIQQQTGASLSEVLLNLSSVIRARYKLRRKIQALSSEAKASAMIIGALPFLVGIGMYFLNPEYAMLLFTTPTGKFWMTGSMVWMGIGIFIMKAMINFKI